MLINDDKISNLDDMKLRVLYDVWCWCENRRYFGWRLRVLDVILLIWEDMFCMFLDKVVWQQNGQGLDIGIHRNWSYEPHDGDK